MIGYTRTLRRPKSNLAAVQKRGLVTTFEANKLQIRIRCLFCVYWPWEIQWHTYIHACVSLDPYSFQECGQKPFILTITLKVFLNVDSFPYKCGVISVLHRCMHLEV